MLCVNIRIDHCQHILCIKCMRKLRKESHLCSICGTHSGRERSPISVTGSKIPELLWRLTKLTKTLSLPVLFNGGFNDFKKVILAWKIDRDTLAQRHLCQIRIEKRSYYNVDINYFWIRYTSYYHGERFLMPLITKLAQNFVGTNNINLLEQHGQFGLRLQGCNHAALRLVTVTLTMLCVNIRIDNCQHILCIKCMRKLRKESHLYLICRTLN
ncbi:DNA topoisomerase 2-beta [Dermatophagoides farinae]|uniref:DNA topoisomerase (ATP-hydrolyzing) n=1 Tax=Dermatophagoides farinae TaxID=6954 RepID=A0A922HKP8_DERFA|nr:DNA topoisomerase 2-beta [Dermatophagoides farinae]